MRNNLREIAAASQHDPKRALLDVIGDTLDDIEVFHNLVLVATYIEPEKTAGGIIKPDKSIQENRFQGKCGLVLKVGPRAFVDQPPHVLFGGAVAAPGDWVVVRPGDGLEAFLGSVKTGGVSVRWFEDTHIKGRVTDPSVIY